LAHLRQVRDRRAGRPRQKEAQPFFWQPGARCARESLAGRAVAAEHSHMRACSGTTEGMRGVQTTCVRREARKRAMCHRWPGGLWYFCSFLCEAEGHCALGQWDCDWGASLARPVVDGVGERGLSVPFRCSLSTRLGLGGWTLGVHSCIIRAPSQCASHVPFLKPYAICVARDVPQARWPGSEEK
jgi:hypothetical protein